MEKVKAVVDGRVEEIERRTYDYVQKCMAVDSQVRTLIASDMVIDEKIKELDRLRVVAGEYDDRSWEGYVTELTNEIRMDLLEIDEHVRPSVDGN